MARAEQRLRIRSRGKTPGLVAALDIGCSKVACLIAQRDLAGLQLLGGGRQQSRGFNGGSITDLEGLERSVRLAVEDAEREYGERIDTVSLGVAGPQVESQLALAGLNVGGRPIGPRDIARVQAAAMAKAASKSRTLLSANVVAYRVDEQEGVRDPSGMHAERLGVLISLTTAPNTLIRNLEECIGRAHLGIDRVAPSAIAAACGALIDDERENGAISIDLGAGVTNVAVYLNGAPAWVDMVPVGGGHVTSDIAQGLGTTFAAAERLKTVCGIANPDALGASERIEAPKLGDDGRLHATRIARAELAKIIHPRLEETFEVVRERLDATPLQKALPRRCVLTGGGSQLAGIREVAAKTLGMPVRLGRPVAADALGETFASPAFSTAAGLLNYDAAGLTDAMRAGFAQGFEGGDAPNGLVNRAFRWLKENF